MFTNFLSTRTRSRNAKVRATRIILESLETRQLLSGGGSGGGLPTIAGLTVTAPTVQYGATPDYAHATATVNSETSQSTTYDYNLISTPNMGATLGDLGSYVPADVGDYSVTATITATNAKGSVTATATVDFDITPAPLTILARSSTKVYDGNTNVTDGATSWWSGETYGSDSLPTTLTESFQSPNVLGTNGSTLVPNTVVVNDGWNGYDYSINYVNAPGTITQATANVSVTPVAGLVYNGRFQQTAAYTATGVGDAPLPLTDFGPTDTLGVTSTEYPYAVTAINNVWTFTDQNYVTQTGTVTGTIAKAPLTITADSLSGTYGTLSPANLGFTTSPLFGIDSVSSVTFVVGDGISNTSGDYNAGTGTITPSAAFGPGLPNYDITYVPGTINVAQAPLIITAVYSTKSYDDTTSVTDGATPTVASLVSGDSVTGLSESFVSSQAGSEATQINPGYVINDGAGGNNYAVGLDQGPGYISQASPLKVSVLVC